MLTINLLKKKKIDKVQITKLQESYGTLVSSGILGADLSKFELDQGTGLLINDSDIVLDGMTYQHHWMR